MRSGRRAGYASSVRPSPVRDRALFDATSDALFIHDLDGRIVEVNERTCEMLGYTREEFRTLDVGDVSLNEAPYTQEHAAHWIQKAAEEGTQIFEWVCRPKAGEPFFVEISLRTAELSGEPYVIASVRDIRARKRNEARRSEDELRVRRLVENMYGIGAYQLRVAANGQRDFLYASPGLASLHGLEVDEILADPNVLYDQLHPEDAAGFMDAEASAIANRQPFLRETRFIGRTGATRHVLLRSNPRPQADGSVLWDGAEIDVTEQRQSEQESARIEAGLRHAQRMESIGRLAGGVAHDFNNFLTAIAGNTSLLRLGTHDPENLTLLDELDQITESAAKLTRELLTFSRKEVVRPQHLDLHATIGEWLPKLRRVVGTEITLDFRPDAANAHIVMDVGQLERVLVNLLTNAREATPRGGRVEITSSDLPQVEPTGAIVEQGPHVRVCIRDTGRGMSDEVKARLFEPFFTTRRSGSGTGLGLAMVHGAVGRAGGRIRVDSVEGQGTTFTLDFPLAAGQLEAPSAKTGDADTVPGGEAVIYVEDEVSVRRITARMLRRAGYEVQEFGDPQEALEKANPAALLITDVIMPELGGRELSERLTERGVVSKTLFLSGYTDEVVLREAVADEDVDFVSKPYSATVLLARVRAALNRD